MLLNQNSALLAKLKIKIKFFNKAIKIDDKPFIEKKKINVF